MFGLGFGEIVLILVVALIVFGPDKMPEVARQMGRFLGEFRRTLDDMKHELATPRYELEQELRRFRTGDLEQSGSPERGALPGSPALTDTCEAGCAHEAAPELAGPTEPQAAAGTGSDPESPPREDTAVVPGAPASRPGGNDE